MITSPIRSPIQSVIRSPLDPALLRIGAQALLVLKSFGTDAHMYLPGIGWVNGADAGNWLDTAFAATAVDSPVGLVMDAANTARAPELVVNGDFTSGTDGWSVSNGSTLSTVGGELVITASGATNFPGAQQNIATVVGKTYELIFTGRRGTAANSIGFNIAPSSPNYNQVFNTTTSDVTVRVVFTATSTSTLLIAFILGTPAAAGTAFFDNISVREVTGAIYASNNTTAQKPILRRDANGRYYHQYTTASSQRLALSAVPFQMSDDHCVGAAVNLALSGSARTIYAQGNGTVSGSVPLLGFTAGGSLLLYYHDGSGSTWSLNGSAGSKVATPLVASFRRSAGAITLNEDSVQVATRSATNNTSASTASFADRTRVSSGEFFDGQFSGAYIIKGTVTDEQRLTLDRCLAAFQGRTL